MYKLFCFCVSASIAFQTPVHADGGQITPPEIVHHVIAQTILDRLIPEIAAIKSAKDAENVFLPLFPKAQDKETLQKTLRKIGAFPKPVRLNRGIGFRQDGRLYTVTYLNLYRGQIQINDKVTWTYQPNNPLSIQLDSIQRLIEKSEKRSAMADFVLPEAHAFTWVIGALIGVVGLAMGAVGNQEIQNYYYPKKVAKFCIEQETKADTLSLQEKYANSKYCEDFEKFKTKNFVPSSPSVDALPTGQASAPIEQKSQCRKAGEDNQISEIKNPMTGVTLKITATFKGNDPVKVISELPSGLVKEYKLEDKKLVSGLTKQGPVESFSSRDPEYLKTLQSDKDRADNLEGMKTYDADMKEVINPVLQDCDNKAKASATAGADKPASALAQEVLSSNPRSKEEQRAVKGIDGRNSATSK